jgi:3-hydroxy-5-phosphonooxypentane-2,4-dione thiolase
MTVAAADSGTIADVQRRDLRAAKGLRLRIGSNGFEERGGRTMPWGLQNRLARIIRPSDGHTVMLAADHGYFLGPTHKLEIPRKTLEPLLPFADAIMVTRGVVRTSIDPGANVPIVLRVSGGASVLNEDLSNEKVTTSMKEAVRLNASAVALSIFVGAVHEHDSLVNLGKLVDEGEEVGIPVLAVTAVGKELEKRDARYLGLACRIAAEFGAHFVKTYFCDEFSKVVESCPVPLVVAGGPKLETELDALELAYESIQEGARGVDMGRNIWQSSNPVGMIRGIRAIVHERATPKEALDLVKGAKPKK